MADSIHPQNLPAGYDAYLGYVDGEWPTAPELKTQFPGRSIVSLTVLGGDAVADGCDVESGDLTPASGARWVQRRIGQGEWRPIVYASVLAMSGVLSALSGVGIARADVRLLSAHYGAGQHICGPSTCKLISIAMDGTQWTDTAAGVGGTQIDASVLEDDFFTPPAPVPVWQEEMVKALPVVKQGDKGQFVRNVQGLLCAHGHTVTIDGNFGPLTESALRAWQTQQKLPVTGQVGSVAWPALLNVS
jgi:peptidoglycan hydrolase-like protein with peptidoglycan-binding domain